MAQMCNVERVDCSDKPTENYPPTLQFSPAPHHSCQPCFQLQRADNFMAKVLKKRGKEAENSPQTRAKRGISIGLLFHEC